MKAAPPAQKEIDPIIALPLALFGVLNRHDATPLAALEAPLTLTPPIDAEQAMPVGRMGDPPFVTRTDATTVEPAPGLAGDSFTALAFAIAGPPPPPLTPPVVSSTTIVIEGISGAYAVPQPVR